MQLNLSQLVQRPQIQTTPKYNERIYFNWKEYHKHVDYLKRVNLKTKVSRGKVSRDEVSPTGRT